MCTEIPTYMITYDHLHSKVLMPLSLFAGPLDVGKPSVRGSVLQDSQANEPKGHPVKAKHAVVSDDYLQKVQIAKFFLSLNKVTVRNS